MSQVTINSGLSTTDATNQKRQPKLTSQRILHNKSHMTSIEGFISKSLVKWDRFIVQTNLNTIMLKLPSLETFLQLNDNDLKTFFSIMAKTIRLHGWKSVKRLELEIDLGPKINDVLLQALGCQVRKIWKDLLYLKLKFGKFSVMTDKGLERLAVSLNKHLPSLKIFNLCIYNCDKATKQGFESFGNTILKHMKLSYLTLDFGGCSKITNDFPRVIGLQISRYLRDLQHLSLNFQLCTNITDEGLENLADTFTNHNQLNLKHLTLNFSCWKATDKGVTALIHKLCQNFRSLQELEFDVSRCYRITDETLNEFGCQIGSYLLNLKSLSFQCMSCGIITDDGLESLCTKVFSFLPNLQKLKLNPGDCQKVTGKSLEMICSKLSTSLRNLEQLNLVFVCCPELTDDALEQFGSSLKNLTNLRRLELNFSNCKKLTESGFEALITNICKHLLNLKHLELFFYNPNAITAKSFQDLSDQINHYQLRLDYLSFRSACGTQEDIIRLKDQLQFITTLIIE